MDERNSVAGRQRRTAVLIATATPMMAVGIALGPVTSPWVTVALCLGSAVHMIVGSALINRRAPKRSGERETGT